MWKRGARALAVIAYIERAHSVTTESGFAFSHAQLESSRLGGALDFARTSALLIGIAFLTIGVTTLVNDNFSFRLEHLQTTVVGFILMVGGAFFAVSSGHRSRSERRKEQEGFETYLNAVRRATAHADELVKDLGEIQQASAGPDRSGGAPR